MTDKGVAGKGEAKEKKRLDLSVPQVAGSAVAAVVAAKLASSFGVYGTILGAGVVSALATSGGTLFQHFFRRTGEQIRDVAVHTKPKARQVPVTEEGRPVPDTFRTFAAAHPEHADGSVNSLDATQVMTTRAQTVGAGGGLPTTTTWGRPGPAAEATTLLPSVGDTDERTRLLRTVPGQEGTVPVPAPASDGEFTEGTVHRTRVKSWKRPLVAAAVVFGVTMGGITTYELVSGQSFNGDSGTTTFRDAFTGHNRSSGDETPAPAGSTQPSDTGSTGDATGGPDTGTDQGGTATPTPKDSTGTGAGTGTGTGKDQGAGTGDGSGDRGSGTSPSPTPTPSQSTSPGAADGGGAAPGSGDGATPAAE